MPISRTASPTIHDSGRGAAHNPDASAWCQTLFLVLKIARKNQEQSLTPSLERLGPSGRPKKRQTKPIQVSHKRLPLNELTSDGFVIVYAKQTQFRVVEDGTSKGWPCRKLARREARLTGFWILDFGLCQRLARMGRGMGRADLETGQRVSTRCRKPKGGACVVSQTRKTTRLICGSCKSCGKAGLKGMAKA